MHGLKPIPIIDCARCALHTAPKLFNPYSSHVLKTCLPACEPNSDPAIKYTFSRQSTFKCALPMSADSISKLFKADNKNAICTLS